MGGNLGLTQGIRRALAISGPTTAVIDGARRFTWRAFADRVARLAGAFRLQGLKDDDRVAFVAMNGHHSLECFYAAFHAGGVIVPMNHRLSVEEIAAQIADCAPRLLLLGAEFADLADALRIAAPSIAATFVIGDEATDAIPFERAIRDAAPIPDAMRAGDDLACLYYTSGTTSAAKGVMLSHANFALNTANVVQGLGLDENAVHLHHGPLFHVAAGARLFSVTQMAATHVFLPRFETGEVLRAIAEHRITHATFVPTMLRMMLDAPDLGEHDLTSLRYISYGSAPMPEALLREMIERWPDVRIVQSYGMTELSPVATMLGWRDHLPAAWDHGRLRSAGRAVAFVDVAVVDPQDRPVPPGTNGEVVVRGPTVMRGYWNRPDLTAATIRDNWLHTGDIGVIDDQGYLFIVDRLKDMIITGGENVYSQEVEQALAMHPAVSQCAVFGRPHERWGEAVHAVVTLKPGQHADPDDLIAHCRDAIAHYKCPRTLEIRETAMPLSGANKIQKSVLRDELLARDG